MRNTRLERIEARMAQLSARRASTLARLKRDQSKLTNRRKFLVGAYVLSKGDGDVRNLSQDIRDGLDRWATRPHDREILGLSVKRPL